MNGALFCLHAICDNRYIALWPASVACEHTYSESAPATRDKTTQRLVAGAGRKQGERNAVAAHVRHICSDGRGSFAFVRGSQNRALHRMLSAAIDDRVVHSRLQKRKTVASVGSIHTSRSSLGGCSRSGAARRPRPSGTAWSSLANIFVSRWRAKPVAKAVFPRNEGGGAGERQSLRGCCFGVHVRLWRANEHPKGCLGLPHLLNISSVNSVLCSIPLISGDSECRDRRCYGRKNFVRPPMDSSRTGGLVNPARYSPYVGVVKSPISALAAGLGMVRWAGVLTKGA